MLVGEAPLPLSFPSSGTWAFYFINRPPWANISDPSVCPSPSPIPRDDYLDCGRCINVSTNWADSDYLSSDVPLNHTESADCLPECEQESIYLLLSSPTDVHHLLFKPANILYLFH